MRFALIVSCFFAFALASNKRKASSALLSDIKKRSRSNLVNNSTEVEELSGSIDDFGSQGQTVTELGEALHELHIDTGLLPVEILGRTICFDKKLIPVIECLNRAYCTTIRGLALRQLLHNFTDSPIQYVPRAIQYMTENHSVSRDIKMKIAVNAIIHHPNDPIIELAVNFLLGLGLSGADHDEIIRQIFEHFTKFKLGNSNLSLLCECLKDVKLRKCLLYPIVLLEGPLSRTITRYMMVNYTLNRNISMRMATDNTSALETKQFLSSLFKKIPKTTEMLCFELALFTILSPGNASIVTIHERTILDKFELDLSEMQKLVLQKINNGVLEDEIIEGACWISMLLPGAPSLRSFTESSIQSKGVFPYKNDVVTEAKKLACAGPFSVKGWSISKKIFMKHAVRQLALPHTGLGNAVWTRPISDSETIEYLLSFSFISIDGVEEFIRSLPLEGCILDHLPLFKILLAYQICGKCITERVASDLFGMLGYRLSLVSYAEALNSSVEFRIIVAATISSHDTFRRKDVLDSILARFPVMNEQLSTMVTAT